MLLFENRREKFKVEIRRAKNNQLLSNLRGNVKFFSNSEISGDEIVDCIISSLKNKDFSEENVNKQLIKFIDLNFNQVSREKIDILMSFLQNSETNFLATKTLSFLTIRSKALTQNLISCGFLDYLVSFLENFRFLKASKEEEINLILDSITFITYDVQNVIFKIKQNLLLLLQPIFFFIVQNKFEEFSIIRLLSTISESGDELTEYRDFVFENFTFAKDCQTVYYLQDLIFKIIQKKEDLNWFMNDPCVLTTLIDQMTTLDNDDISYNSLNILFTILDLESKISSFNKLFVTIICIFLKNPNQNIRERILDIVSAIQHNYSMVETKDQVKIFILEILKKEENLYQKSIGKFLDVIYTHVSQNEKDIKEIFNPFLFTLVIQGLDHSVSTKIKAIVLLHICLDYLCHSNPNQKFIKLLSERGIIDKIEVLATENTLSKLSLEANSFMNLLN